MNAATADRSGAGSSRTPPVAGAPNTKTFFAHCRGRAVETMALVRPVLRDSPVATPSTWTGDGDSSTSSGTPAPVSVLSMSSAGGYVSTALGTIRSREPGRLLRSDRAPHGSQAGNGRRQQRHQQPHGRPGHDLVGEPERLRQGADPQQGQDGGDRDAGEPSS